MAIRRSHCHRIWTVAEARARLSEVLRLSETEGPQGIGTRRKYVVVPASLWYGRPEPRSDLGRWLIENTPRGAELEVPGRLEIDREIPFIDEPSE